MLSSFDVRDEFANSMGGMLVIAMTIPGGRDWTQWKGRTARGDRNGQLAVVLSSEDPLIASIDSQELEKCKVIGSKSVYNRDLIDLALSYHDKTTAERLALQAEVVFKGQRLNELCDRYHEYFHPSGSRKGEF